MQLHDLKPNSASRTRKSRVGRGIAAGRGKTCGRGTKGQKSRTNIHPRFEGGQTPIHRRLPIKKGFRNPNSKEFAVLNVQALEKRFEDGGEVSPDAAREKGLIGKTRDGLKILGFGSLTKKLKVTANAFSATAEKKITKAGGEVIRL